MQFEDPCSGSVFPQKLFHLSTYSQSIRRVKLDSDLSAPFFTGKVTFLCISAAVLTARVFSIFSYTREMDVDQPEPTGRKPLEWVPKQYAKDVVATDLRMAK